MRTHPLRRVLSIALAVLIATFGGRASAAVSVHIVRTDLRPLVRASAQSPVQFAVLIPYSVSTAADGNWSTRGSLATWEYAVQGPTAISWSSASGGGFQTDGHAGDFGDAGGAESLHGSSSRGSAQMGRTLFRIRTSSA